MLELRGKATAGGEGGTKGGDGEVIDALVGLGYSLREARDAVQEIPKELETSEARLREALRRASRTR